MRGIGWRECRETDSQPLMRFLRSYEWAWTGFTSRYTAVEGFEPNHRSSDTILVCESSNTLRGAIYVTRHGLLLPALQPDRSDEGIGSRTEINIRKAHSSTSSLVSTRLRDFIRGRRIHTVMGLSRDVAAVSKIVTRPHRATIEYHLMKLDRWDRAFLRLTEVEFLNAGRRDLRRLMPLQAAYEKEEVLLDPSGFNASITRAYLLQTLNDQIVVMACERNPIESGSSIPGPWRRPLRPIAKASTNAKGIGYYQIGGVFTEKAYRGRGIGRNVVAYLLDQIFDAGRRACLFVKKDNVPAIAMYRRLGFEEAGEYRIDYFR